MKVLAVKSIEVFGNLWTVRYTRLTKRGSKQDAHFLFNTPEEARQKLYELMDIVEHHDGVYVGRKAKRKVKTTNTRP